ncbi:MAG: hypothetical protein RL708_2683 [Bacteroidota bacterium]|jgi:hypothetical protein
MSQSKSTSHKSTVNKSSTPSKLQNFNGVLLFDKTSYLLMGACIALVAIGFVLMSGGKSPNPAEFHPETLYSTTRVTIAPMMILIGFGVGIYSIMRKSSEA